MATTTTAITARKMGCRIRKIRPKRWPKPKPRRKGKRLTGGPSRVGGRYRRHADGRHGRTGASSHCGPPGLRGRPNICSYVAQRDVPMAELTSLHDAVAGLVHDGDTVALEGFTHLIPTLAGHEIIRQGRRDLTLVRMTPDLVYDQMIGMGVASKLVFSWG